jgi:hypothetical protein
LAKYRNEWKKYMGLTRIRAQQISDIDYKQAVRVVTTTDISLIGGAPSSVDGVSLMVNDRILVTAQDPGSENGIYRVQTLGTGSNGTWVRTADANETGEVQPGMVVMVTEGDEYADRPWKLVTNGEIIIGVTELNFEIFNGGGGGTPGGANTEIQFNNDGAFGGSANLTWNGTELLIQGAANVVGNINADFFVGNGSLLTGITSVDLSAVDQNIVPAANITYDLGNSTNRWNDIWLANSTIYLGSAQISANNTSLTLTNPEGGITAFSGSNTSLEVSSISAAGNIAGEFFIGNGSQLTGISTSTDKIFNGNSEISIPQSGGNANVTISGVSNVAVFFNSGLEIVGTFKASGNANVGNLAATNVAATDLSGTLTTAAQTNITSLGTLNSLTVTGNITGGNLSGTNIVGTLTTAAQTNITSLGTLTQLSVTGNITGGNLITAGLVSLSSITKTGSNGVGNIGSSTSTFDTIFAKATSAQYADLAERYRSDKNYQPGTVLEIGGNQEVTATKSYASTRIVGVVSTEPAFVMNAGFNSTNTVPVALIGRVPCRVIGPVHRGDLLCSSDTPGVATALNKDKYQPGCVIGKSLEDSASVGETLIEVLVGRL